MKTIFSKAHAEIAAIDAAQRFAKHMRQWSNATWKTYCNDFDFCLSKDLETNNSTRKQMTVS